MAAIYGFCIYVLERTAQPDVFDIAGSLYLGLQCILTGWPSDVYDEYDPSTHAARLVAMMGSVSGLFLTSLVIGVFCQWLLPTRFEETAVQWVTLKDLKEREMEAAAKVIQFAWRNYMHECELEETLAESNPEKYEEISEKEEKEFIRGFWKRAHQFRRFRKERLELEEA
jgi:hypothetical protein